MLTQDIPTDTIGKPTGRDDAIDLSAYLARIGYTGPLRPTPDVLAELIERHMATIPFEAIDVMLGRGIELSPERVDRKLLARRRGGYCFEHESTLRRALVAIGFPVEPLLARVLVHPASDGSTPPATQCVAPRSKRVGSSVGLPIPVSAVSCRTCPWPGRSAPPRRRGSVFSESRIRTMASLSELRNDDGWSPLYEILRFRWQRMDFEVANHYVAHRPSSPFQTTLMVVRTEVETRYTLAGNRLTIHSSGGSREERQLDADGIETALGTIFGLPVEPEWRPLIGAGATDRNR